MVTTAPPPPPPSDGQSRFLGVPEDYAHIGPRQANQGDGAWWPTPTVSPPRYMTGDELAPSTLPPEMVAQMQQQLAQAGLLTGKIRIGVWDDKSVAAYRNVLEFANQNGVDETAALSMLATAPTVDTGTEGGNSVGARLPADPATVRMEVRKVAAEILGRDIDDDEIDFLVGQYKSLEQQDIEQESGLAAVAASPFTFDGSDEAVPDDVEDFDAQARFVAMFEDRYASQIDRAKRMDERAENSESLSQSIFNMGNAVGA